MYVCIDIFLITKTIIKNYIKYICEIELFKIAY